ncbi:MAG: leucine-rich repeat protein [Alistipes sp.]|nr:leucine-rich repeat protein [Alistipes sp.]
MKRLLLLFTLAFVAMSCEEIQDLIDPKGHGLVFLEGEMKAYFDDKGDTKNYKFKADLAWSAEVSADWVEVDPTSGPAGENKIKIKVDKNKSDEKRTGYVDITLSNDKSYRIELEQMAAGENLDDVIPSISIPSNEIWYTSADGNIVEPYSGEGSQDNFAVFGANIVSNTYDPVKKCRIIKFDGDVTSVGSFAFYECSSIAYMIIPESVTTIGDYAFYWCRSLTSVTIPDSVTTIGEHTFYNCSSLRSVTIPDSVTTIGEDAFADCSSLTSVTIPDSVTTIGVGAFLDCSSLTSVTIGDSVTTIGDWAFSDCSSLTRFNGKYASEDGRCLIIDGALHSFAPAGLTEYTIPVSVTTIGYAAFYDCSSLTSVTIPDSVTTIGEWAFGFCSSLTSVTIPDGVTIIGWSAFARCSSLTSVTIGGSVTTIGNYAFSGCSSLTSVTIPDSVTTIGYGAFRGCSNLTSVTIPDSVTEIGGSAFRDCSSLTSVTIPDSVTTIGNAIFGGGSNLTEFNGKYASEDGRCLIIDGALHSFAPAGLTEYTIPDSVTTIGDYAFIGCSSLTSITIPDSVTTIRWRAFEYCSSLTSVYCKAVTPPIAVIYDGYWCAFEQNASGRKIYVPTESVEVYKSATGWSDYADAIVGYDF